MKRLYRSSITWSPVILRGTLYVAIATGTEYVSLMRGISHDEMELFTWKDWSVVVLQIILAGLLILRTYIDSSFATHKAKVEGAETASIVGSTSVPITTNEEISRAAGGSVASGS